MRKVRLFIASSLDGYIARSSGVVDWLFTDADYGYTEFFSQIDTVLMGHKTYQQVLEFGDYPYPGKRGIVFSKQRQGEKDQNVEFIGQNVGRFIQDLKHQSGQDIWLVGGAELIHFFLKNKLLDELMLSIHPIILGQGIPLILPDESLQTFLHFKQVQCYPSGLLQVIYNLISA